MLRPTQEQPNGGASIADVLQERGIQQVFTLCGGHISPILVESKARGIQVVDMRDEKSAVFAADAAARMTGIPGVAAVTAGPGVTNTVTALKNAQMAQSPLVLLGGATGTLLKGRGALQDIDQLSLMATTTKWVTSVSTLPSLGPTVRKALHVARDGVPGPVFVEVPVDLLYPEELVIDQYLTDTGAKAATGLGGKALELALRGYLYRQFHQPHLRPQWSLPTTESMRARLSHRSSLKKLARALNNAQRPVLVVGSQALVNDATPERLAEAVQKLGMPSYLAGTARGLLGRHSDIQFRHKRSKALAEADLVIVAGFPFDFRLGYGRSISKKATVAAANLDREELTKNRTPEMRFEMHPGTFLKELAQQADGATARWADWMQTLRQREHQREAEIAEKAANPSELVNPLHFFRRLEQLMDDDAVLVVDGGDFVATGAYILRPRAPLCWLDPGAFGTLGVGGGFSVGAALCRPNQELWLLYGDGSCACSIAEFDTCVRHGLAPIAVVGNDGSWAQIAREQVEMLGNDVGTTLLRTDYHRVAEGYGGVGLLLDDPSRIDAVLAAAKEHARAGRPVLINVHIDKTDFRKGSISM